MNNIKAFRIVTLLQGKVKDIVIAYYKNINGVDVFSCNDIDSCRIFKINKDEHIIVVGSKIISTLGTDALEVLIWSMILKLDTGLYRITEEEYRIYYIDKLLASMFGVTSVINMLNQISNIESLSENQLELIENRKIYLEDIIFNNIKLQEIDAESILDRVKITKILEVA